MLRTNTLNKVSASVKVNTSYIICYVIQYEDESSSFKLDGVYHSLTAMMEARSRILDLEERGKNRDRNDRGNKIIKDIDIELIPIHWDERQWVQDDVEYKTSLEDIIAEGDNKGGGDLAQLFQILAKKAEKADEEDAGQDETSGD